MNLYFYIIYIGARKLFDTQNTLDVNTRFDSLSATENLDIKYNISKWL